MTQETVEIQDGGDKIVCCKDCGKQLMVYRVYAPKVDFIHKLKATCPYCDSESFVVSVAGMFYYGPISQETSQNPTVIDSIDMDTQPGVSIFKVKSRRV